MKRAALFLVIGILIGVVVAFVSVDIAGGWYVYEIWPETRCKPSGHVVTGVPEPVPGSTNPCLFRSRRWSLIG